MTRRATPEQAVPAAASTSTTAASAACGLPAPLDKSEHQATAKIEASAANQRVLNAANGAEADCVAQAPPAFWPLFSAAADVQRAAQSVEKTARSAHMQRS
jgi:hypothetical protein